MPGIGTVAIDGPRFEEFLRSRKEFFEVSQGGVSQGGLARILLLGCTAGLIFCFGGKFLFMISLFDSFNRWEGISYFIKFCTYFFLLFASFNLSFKDNNLS